MDIRKTKGICVNPREAYCPRCGGDAPSLIDIGKQDQVCQCRNCGVRLYGFTSGLKCPGCGLSGAFKYLRRLWKNEKVPGSPCDYCLDEINEHAEIVAAGGVYFRCLKCNQSGVIKENAFSIDVRNEHRIAAPAPCGVEFNQDEPCPKCQEEKS